VNPDTLGQLLRGADNAAGPPRPATDVVERVRRRHARRRRAGRAVAAAGGMVAVALIAFAASLARPPEPDMVRVTEDVGPTPETQPGRADRQPLDGVAARVELARLERECELRERVIARALAGTASPAVGGPARGHARAARMDPLIELDWQREQAALVLVRQGDRLGGELKLPHPAAVAYRQASETFPGTRWGAVARARLAAVRDAVP
jgi:hypothetical protein